MNLLALDTSTAYCSAALWCDGVLDIRESHAGQRHTERLLGMVDTLLAARALRVADLAAVAFGAGPGSFTGLRIACGVAQGLAFSASLPVVGIGTLLAMAAGTGARRVVCSLDARMNEIYHAAYECAGDEWQVAVAPSVCAPDRAPPLAGGGWLACGNAFSVYRDRLCERYNGQLSAIDPDCVPHAREIARLAVQRFRAGDAVPAEAAAPLYLRDKVALRSDERRHR